MGVAHGFNLSVLGPGSFDRATGTIAPTGRTMRRLSVQARRGRACTSDGSKGLPSSHRGFASPRLASAQLWGPDRSRDARATKHAGKSEARSLSVIRLNHACFVGDGRSDMGYGMIVEGGRGQAGGDLLRLGLRLRKAESGKNHERTASFLDFGGLILYEDGD